jgi:hypothetical protein
MTLCMAAIADLHSGNPRVVLCSDMLLGDEYQKIETEAKSDVGFSDTIAALYSGPWEHTMNLKRVLTRRVRATPLTLDNYRGVLQEGWEEFDQIPRGQHDAQTDAECIVAGFIEGEARIIRVKKDGVDTFPYHTVAGIGGYHADTILCWRKLTQYDSVERVLYYLYEAKRFGELCGDVGRGTIMEVLSLDQNGELQVDLVMGTGLTRMAKWFAMFGPRQVGYDLSFADAELHRMNPD